MTQSLTRLGGSDPQRLGPYRLHGVLGGGVLGPVYLGRSTARRDANKPYAAVRALRPELLRDRLLRAQLRRTLLSAAGTKSPYVAPVRACELDSELPWLATDFVFGLPLGQLIERYGPLPERAVRELGGALTQALIALHGVQVAHHDLRPNNVLLADDHPRVIDYGLGLATGNDVTDGDSSAEDVFDLGVLLAYAATARHPFHDSLLPTTRDSPDLTGVPASLHPMLLACLHKTPEHRPRPYELLPALAPRNRPTRPAQDWLPEPYLLEIDALEETVRQQGGRRFFGRG